MTRIMGIMLMDRGATAKSIQNVLSENGCIIKTRLGLHEANDDKCAKNGLVLLELTGSKADWLKIESDIRKVGGVEVKYMDFDL